MSDLISRQAARDVVAGMDSYFCKYIDEIPSAQQEIIRCKDCKYRIVNEHYGQKGYIKLKAMCELDTGDYFELGRNAEDDDWFCADAERRTDG